MAANYLNECIARMTWAQLGRKTISNYGTSFPRWSIWMLGTIGTFSVLSDLFFRLHWLEPMEPAAPIA